MGQIGGKTAHLDLITLAIIISHNRQRPTCRSQYTISNVKEELSRHLNMISKNLYSPHKTKC